MRMLAATVGAVVLGLMQATGAQAISEKNQAALAEYFATLGEIHYELYAPLGGPDLGGAVIKQGSGAQLCIAQVDQGGVKQLLSVPLAQVGGKPPFTFLFSGHQALIYATQDWIDAKGVTHQRGDLLIYELATEEAPVKLFELKDVCDLSYQAGGAMSTENLLWQPAPHFLNRTGALPVKSNYVQLTLNPLPTAAAAAGADTQAQGEPVAEAAAADGAEAETLAPPAVAEKREWPYELSQHLQALPSAATVDAANLNNRAILRYRQNRLFEASRLLEQADNVADADQSVIARNQALINSEIDDLGAQANKFPDRPYDEALQYYWQGDYLAVLRVMEARGRAGFSELDYALLGLALAHEERWPEADRMTVELERQGVPYLADYLWELTKIALSQGHEAIANARLLALESIDRQHPGYITGWAQLLQRTGNRQQAQRVLQEYLFSAGTPAVDLSEPRLELYKLYYQQGNLAGCERLERDALAGPLLNLLGYVELADYVDFTTALTDVPIETSGRLRAPELPLETFEIN